MKGRAFLLCPLLALNAGAMPLHGQDKTCKKTSVAILGAGTAGITAAQALSNASVTDFVIVEFNSDIGGRAAHTTFGRKPNGLPYTIELGANWVQGLGTPPGPENPIWTLAKKYNLTNAYSNFSSIETFTAAGPLDYTHLIGQFEDAYSLTEQDAGYILTENLQDRSLRSGFSLAGWKPNMDMQAGAVEWFENDFDDAFPPEQCSQLFAITGYNTTFYQYSEENNFVFDERGFNAFLKGEASTFLGANDPRLLLNTIVTNISYSDDAVIVSNSDGSCIEASYAICTFSLGVLQHDTATFSPSLPSWKRIGIETFAMGTYTKIFLQFPPDKIFWNTSTQFFLYADPYERGYYPLFQSLDHPDFLPGSGIIFVTVTAAQSYFVEAQDDETTKAQVIDVLRDMFGADNVPDPIAFHYPRWSQEPWAYGSYSNWPPSTTLETHQNLRANVARLYFAGEHTSAQYFGFLHGAYDEGKKVGRLVAGCLAGELCEGEARYEVLRRTTEMEEFDEVNGWSMGSNFLTYGIEGESDTESVTSHSPQDRTFR